MVDTEDEPVAKPYFIFIISAFWLQSFDRAKWRVQNTCDNHYDFPTMSDKQNQTHQK